MALLIRDARVRRTAEIHHERFRKLPERVAVDRHAQRLAGKSCPVERSETYGLRDVVAPRGGGHIRRRVVHRHGVGAGRGQANGEIGVNRARVPFSHRDVVDGQGARVGKHQGRSVGPEIFTVGGSVVPESNAVPEHHVLAVDVLPGHVQVGVRSVAADPGASAVVELAALEREGPEVSHSPGVGDVRLFGPGTSFETASADRVPHAPFPAGRGGECSRWASVVSTYSQKPELYSWSIASLGASPTSKSIRQYTLW